MIDHIEMQKGVYADRLMDKRWRELRDLILSRDSHRCRCCGSTSQLTVHHRQYHRRKDSMEWLKPWEYHPKLLITLCHDCHSKGHELYSVPIKNI